MPTCYRDDHINPSTALKVLSAGDSAASNLDWMTGRRVEAEAEATYLNFF